MDLNRRQVLKSFGTVGLGALLAACRSSTDTPSSTAVVSTLEGSTTTVQPQTPSSNSVTTLFDEAASCILTPEQTEGPYYFDVDSIRSDLREDREGVPLRLAVKVQDSPACDPIANAAVDIWHCDAVGLYSGFESASLGGPGGGGGPTDEETYLRGVQVTNAEGVVEFLTIFPGWYRPHRPHPRQGPPRQQHGSD